MSEVSYESSTLYIGDHSVSLENEIADVVVEDEMASLVYVILESEPNDDVRNILAFDHDCNQVWRVSRPPKSQSPYSSLSQRHQDLIAVTTTSEEYRVNKSTGGVTKVQLHIECSDREITIKETETTVSFESQIDGISVDDDNQQVYVLLRSGPRHDVRNIIALSSSGQRLWTISSTGELPFEGMPYRSIAMEDDELIAHTYDYKYKVNLQTGEVEQLEWRGK